ncbi:MAG: hypothetical protein IJJ33_08035, partial [Victivallales bacterium]|nr:hypothetical protein [Victivallales bacterium]
MKKLWLALMVMTGLFALGQEDWLPEVKRLFSDGKYEQALNCTKQALDRPDALPGQSGEALLWASLCLDKLRRLNEWDALLERGIARFPANPIFASKVSRIHVTGWGTLVNDEFRRGENNWPQVNDTWRDTILRLRLFEQAMPNLGQCPVGWQVVFYSNFADLLRQGNALSLLLKTDLTELPRHGECAPSVAGNGYPAQKDGETPLWFGVPSSWESAANDGERWRWLLSKLAALDADGEFAALYRMANFGKTYLNETSGFDTERYPLESLAENETYVRIGEIIHRVTLPDEYNFLHHYRRMLELHPDQPVHAGALAQCHMSRRQYDLALPWWEVYRKYDEKRAEYNIRQITDDLCSFEPMPSQPAAHPIRPRLVFRNARSVQFTARQVDVLALAKAACGGVKRSALFQRLALHPKWDDLSSFVESIPERMDEAGEKKFWQGKPVTWSEELQPTAGHLDTVHTVTVPPLSAGVWLLEARMPGGHRVRTCLLLESLRVLRVGTLEQTRLQVLDAMSGAPVAGATVQAIGEKAVWKEKRRVLEITEFSGKTDGNGLYAASELFSSNYSSWQWLATVKTEDGRTALWCGSSGCPLVYDPNCDTRVYGVTDRPVYRPGDTVHARLWMAQPDYTMETPNSFAGRKVKVLLCSPTGDKIQETELTCDSCGAVDFEWMVPADTKLGSWSLHADYFHNSAVSFRVEEYRKPEYEVTVTGPKEAVSLGEKIDFTVQAKYYFGGPVTDGQVNLRIYGELNDDDWYPPLPWDWFYGRGYFWRPFEQLRNDNPGGRGGYGRRRVEPRTFHGASPLVALDIEGELDENGTFHATLDTARELASLGGHAVRYTAVATVQDASRATIIGNATAYASQTPFRVHLWHDRGFYNVGRKGTLSAIATLQDGTQMPGAGLLKLARLHYGADGKATEETVREWTIELSAEKVSRQEFSATAPGVYLASLTVTDERGRSVSASTQIHIVGAGDDGHGFDGDGLKLTVEKPDYRPGETARLAIQTARPDAFVTLNMRANVGSSQLEGLWTRGHTLVRDIEITAKDCPNFFVEGWTVADGQVHHVVERVLVPPSSRVLEVTLTPEKSSVKPGAKTFLRIRAQGLDGAPVQSTVTVAVYDRSLDYIADRVEADVRERFYSGLRSYHSCLAWSDYTFPNDTFAQWDMASLSTLGLNADIRPATVHCKHRYFHGGRDFGFMKAGAVAEDGGVVLESRAENNIQTDTPAIHIRTDFADTALWTVTAMLDERGEAIVPFTLPENLTDWACRAWVITDTTRVGSAKCRFATAKELMVRLEAPRLLVQGDNVTLSALADNQSEETQRVRVSLKPDSLLAVESPLEITVDVPPKGQRRVEWSARAASIGDTKIQVTAVSSNDSDGMELTLPIVVHGLEKMVAASRALPAGNSEEPLALEVPEKIRGTAKLQLRWSPSLALAMLDALPYLLDYPYGCTEQTLNRFVPAVLAQGVLRNLGLSLEDIRSHSANLNAQELGDAELRRAQWSRYDRSPVFDTAEMEKMVAKGVKDLLAMQCSDGGWGWFSGYGEHSSAHTTCVVLHGLELALANGVKMPQRALKDARKWLSRHQDEQLRELKAAPLKKDGPRKDNPSPIDALVYATLVESKINSPDMADYLYRARTDFSLYVNARLAQAFFLLNDPRWKEIHKYIRQWLRQDDENQTAWLELRNNGYWWHWYGDEFETYAAFLKLTLLANPQDPVAPRLVKYLLNNRKHATYWRSTRDTAACLEAFAEYIAATGENKPDAKVEILLDGQLVASSRITAENLFSAELGLEREIPTGRHELTVRHSGTSPLYLNSYLEYFSLQDFIPAAGLEVKVDRQVYRLVKDDETRKAVSSSGQVVEQREERFLRERLESGAAVQPGDLLEVVLTLESKNDYEYLCIEDRKVAGTEPEDVRSGYRWMNGLPAYMEFRARHVAAMLHRLPRGTSVISYRLRAQFPGQYSALPATAVGMYAPELKANSDELKLRVL